MRTFKQMLKDRKMFKSITLFFDIETFQYNELEGEEKPSKYKNMTFSVAVSWIEKGQVEYEIFLNFKEMFDIIIEVYGSVKKKPLIKLNVHNKNKKSLKIKEIKAEDKKGIILEKRIKSSINLEMIFFLEGIKFETEDNWVKTNSSISMLGKKLLRLGVVTEDELKTDFDYKKHN